MFVQLNVSFGELLRKYVFYFINRLILSDNNNNNNNIYLKSNIQSSSIDYKYK